MAERSIGGQHVNETVFEIAASLGQVRLQGMPVPNLGPVHASLVRLPIGRGPRGVVTMGERALIIAPLVGQAALDSLPEAAQAAPVDMLEWRVDLYEPFLQARSERERAGALVQGMEAVLMSAPVPVLATIRTRDEGGEVSLDAREYAALVGLLAQRCDAVDVQAYAPLSVEQVRVVVEDAHGAGAVVVASNHDFVQAPSEDEIVGRLYAMKRVGADVAKVAYRVDEPAQAFALMNAQMRARTLLHMPIVCIGMGNSGALTRICGNAIGSAATFATIGQNSAPGQFTVEQVRQALDLMES